MKHTVNVEDVVAHWEFFTRLQKLDLANVVFMENGEPIEYPQSIVEEFKFIGLANRDFVLSRYWERKQEGGGKCS